MPSNKATNFTERLIFGLCLLAVFCLAYFYHDKFWWGPDDAHYGHVSQRLLEGKILNKDVQVLHAGPIYFLNALFLKIAGGDIVGMRYPLILITLVQSCFGYWLARPLGRLAAVTSALTLAAFGFIQFINPTPNWYTLCIAVILAFILTRSNTRSMRSLIMLGFLVGLCFLFRQLSGIFLAFAVTTIVFLKNSDFNEGGQPLTGTVILLALSVSLLYYLKTSSNIAGLLLMGLTPVVIMASAAFKCRINVQTAARLISILFLGACLAALPVILYHTGNGSLMYWIKDCFIAPLTFTEMAHLKKASYFSLPVLSLRGAYSGNFYAIVGFVYWTVLLLAPLLLGILVIRKLLRSPDAPYSLGIVACFFSLVSIYYEIPIYLIYPTGLTLVAFLLLNRQSKILAFKSFTLLGLSIIAVYSHAAQPLERGLPNTAMGKKLNITWKQLPGHSVLVSETEADFYNRINAAIDMCSNPTDKIFAYPSNNDIYLLSGRQSVFRFLHSLHGVNTEPRVLEIAERIRTGQNPSLIIHNTTDKFNTHLTNDLLVRISPYYRLVEQVDNFDIYQRLEHDKNCSP